MNWINNRTPEEKKFFNKVYNFTEKQTILLRYPSRETSTSITYIKPQPEYPGKFFDLGSDSDINLSNTIIVESLIELDAINFELIANDLITKFDIDLTTLYFTYLDDAQISSQILSDVATPVEPGMPPEPNITNITQLLTQQKIKVEAYQLISREVPITEISVNVSLSDLYQQRQFNLIQQSVMTSQENFTKLAEQELTQKSVSISDNTLQGTFLSNQVLSTEFYIQNFTSYERTELMKASIPFSEGEIELADLLNMSVQGGSPTNRRVFETAWMPMMYWPDGSIKLAQAQFIETLPACTAQDPDRNPIEFNYTVTAGYPSVTGSFVRNTLVQNSNFTLGAEVGDFYNNFYRNFAISGSDMEDYPDTDTIKEVVQETALCRVTKYRIFHKFIGHPSSLNATHKGVHNYEIYPNPGPIKFNNENRDYLMSLFYVTEYRDLPFVTIDWVLSNDYRGVTGISGYSRTIDNLSLALTVTNPVDRPLGTVDISFPKIFINGASSVGIYRKEHQIKEGIGSLESNTTMSTGGIIASGAFPENNATTYAINCSAIYVMKDLKTWNNIYAPNSTNYSVLTGTLARYLDPNDTYYLGYHNHHYTENAVFGRGTLYDGQQKRYRFFANFSQSASSINTINAMEKLTTFPLPYRDYIRSTNALGLLGGPVSGATNIRNLSINDYNSLFENANKFGTFGSRNDAQTVNQTGSPRNSPGAGHILPIAIQSNYSKYLTYLEQKAWIQHSRPQNWYSLSSIVPWEFENDDYVLIFDEGKPLGAASQDFIARSRESSVGNNYQYGNYIFGNPKPFDPTLGRTTYTQNNWSSRVNLISYNRIHFFPTSITNINGTTSPSIAYQSKSYGWQGLNRNHFTFDYEYNYWYATNDPIAYEQILNLSWLAIAYSRGNGSGLPEWYGGYGTNSLTNRSNSTRAEGWLMQAMCFGHLLSRNPIFKTYLDRRKNEVILPTKNVFGSSVTNVIAAQGWESNVRRYIPASSLFTVVFHHGIFLLCSLAAYKVFDDRAYLDLAVSAYDHINKCLIENKVIYEPSGSEIVLSPTANQTSDQYLAYVAFSSAYNNDNLRSVSRVVPTYYQKALRYYAPIAIKIPNGWRLNYTQVDTPITLVNLDYYDSSGLLPSSTYPTLLAQRYPSGDLGVPTQVQKQFGTYTQGVGTLGDIAGGLAQLAYIIKYDSEYSYLFNDIKEILDYCFPTPIPFTDATYKFRSGDANVWWMSCSQEWEEEYSPQSPNNFIEFNSFSVVDPTKTIKTSIGVPTIKITSVDSEAVFTDDVIPNSEGYIENINEKALFNFNVTLYGDETRIDLTNNLSYNII